MENSSRRLEDAVFRNSLVDTLPGESQGPPSPRQVPGVCYSRVIPSPVKNPRMLAWAKPLAAFLNLGTPQEFAVEASILGGNKLVDSMKPFAARYGGHQFGNWAGQLGDGRAISLGELEARDGSFWEVQLKGAGPTPYSRHADGRAVLRSSLREFLCSEAMHYLGVPTTRALSLVETGDSVVRDMFYTGDPRREPGAIVARVAPTFVRFGNFEILAHCGELENLRALTDYVITNYFPQLGHPSEEVYGQWFAEVARRTAEMIAHWMTVGFVHGVMNTDNMSILGLTIDYGPYGWLEPYDPEWTPNTTDFREHRYAFGQQPRVALWNLAMLGRAITPLLSDGSAIQKGLDEYPTTFAKTYFDIMSKKLGFTPQVGDDDEELITDLHEPFTLSQIDMTIFFRRLSGLVHSNPSIELSHSNVFDDLIESSSYLALQGHDHSRLRQWLDRYLLRMKKEARPSESIRSSMLEVNPKYVLRNYLAQQAIDRATEGDDSLIRILQKVLEKPFDEHPDHDELSAKRPDWAKDKPGCATLSCSS